MASLPSPIAMSWRCVTTPCCFAASLAIRTSGLDVSSPICRSKCIGAQRATRACAIGAAFVALRCQACEQTLERGAEDRALEVLVRRGELGEDQAGDRRHDDVSVGLGVVGA